MNRKINDIGIIRLKETVSTNEEAKRIAENEENWTVVAADRQLSGKGSKGRSFYSPEGGVYFTVIVKTPVDYLLLTPYAAVAACRGIKLVTGLQCGIKWVNDLYLGGKKVCGILTESKICGEDRFALVGIGINLYPSEKSVYPEIAGFLFDKKPQKDFFEDIVGRVSAELRSICEKEPSESVMAEYASLSVLIGEEVVYSDNGKAETVTVTGISPRGELITRSEQGEIAFRSGGDIVWKKNKR